MEQFLEVWQYEWAVRALIASVVVGIICGVLGCFIVLRNMSMVGDALSHAVLPGVVLAFVLFGYNSLGFFAGAVLAGLVTAVLIIWIQQNVKTKNDAAIGIVFTAMFSIGVIGISKISKNDGVHLDLKDFLFGNILGVSNADIRLNVIIGCFIILSVLLFYRHLFVSTFQPVIARTMGFNVHLLHYFLMLLLSFAVVASIQTVGVILVVSMLITPAAAALLLSNHLKIVLLISSGIGILSAVIGMSLAIVFNTTPGPVIALVATGFYIMAAVLAPEKGLLLVWWGKQKRQFKIRREDFLKESYKLIEKGQYNKVDLKRKLEWPPVLFPLIHHQLVTKGLAMKNLQSTPLTDNGMQRASRMVRAHRLWESYMVEKMGMKKDQIHEEAEKLEHHLTDDILRELDDALGSPAKDPHGSLIPSSTHSGQLISGQRLSEGQRFYISNDNPTDILNALEDFQLEPDKSLYLKRKTKGYWHVKSQDRQLMVVPKNLFRNLKVEV
ncbi:MAG TPA: iron chelate uptake ABC transporter family permease subunit [Saprospiraceae bacterium]|nr:iron chelate uptake ABC transporter family permease subunit [Saprospiraceae bacterium]